MTGLHAQFADTALTSVAGNVETAKQRLTFADQNISTARTLVARPAGSQGGLVDAVRAAESALGQARTMLDAVDSAATDINRAVAGAAVGDRRHPGRHQRRPTALLARATHRAPTNSAPAADAAVDGGVERAEQRATPIRSARSPS